MTDSLLLPFDEVAEARIARRAREFHAQNPQVMEQLVRIGRDLRKRNVRRVGIALLFERLRWISLVKTGGDKYALNNRTAIAPGTHTKQARQLSATERAIELTRQRLERDGQAVQA